MDKREYDAFVLQQVCGTFTDKTSLMSNAIALLGSTRPCDFVQLCCWHGASSSSSCGRTQWCKLYRTLCHKKLTDGNFPLAS